MKRVVAIVGIAGPLGCAIVFLLAFLMSALGGGDVLVRIVNNQAWPGAIVLTVFVVLGFAALVREMLRN